MIVLYISAYMLIAAFLLLERFCRKGEDSKNMRRSKFDKGSTTLVSVAMGTAFIIIPLSPLANLFGFGPLRIIWLGVAGIVLGAVGLVIRYISFRTLGRFLTRTLREVDNHTLVTSGIYAYIRHPGYLGDLMIFIGAGFAMENRVTMIAVSVLFLIAYSYRIRTEEKMLIRIFGEQYAEYRKKTKRLIPFVY